MPQNSIRYARLDSRVKFCHVKILLELIDIVIFFNFQIKVSPHLINVVPEKIDANLSEHQVNTTTDLGTKDLFKHAGSRKVTLVMMIIWIAVNLGTYECQKYWCFD